MNIDTKKILLIISAAVIIAIPIGLFRFKQTMVMQRIVTLDSLSKEKIGRDKANDNLSFEKKQRDELKESLEKAKQREKALKSDLLKYNTEIDSGKERLTAAEDKTASIESRLKVAASNTTELKSRVANIVKDTLKLTDELTLLQKTRDALKARLEEYIEKKKNIERGPVTTLPSIVSSSDNSQREDTVTPNPRLAGEVLTVNREFDFVVLNLGRASGIEEGMIFDVLRDNKVLGRAAVETVRENISAATLIEKENILEIRAGDKVYL